MRLAILWHDCGFNPRIVRRKPAVPTAHFDGKDIVLVAVSGAVRLTPSALRQVEALTVEIGWRCD